MGRRGCKKGGKKATKIVEYADTIYAMPVQALTDQDALNDGHLDKLHLKSMMVIFILNSTCLVGFTSFIQCWIVKWICCYSNVIAIAEHFNFCNHVLLAVIEEGFYFDEVTITLVYMMSGKHALILCGGS